MIILDTDHLSILQHPESSRYHTLIVRMSSAADREFVAAAISVEEEFRGGLPLSIELKTPTAKFCTIHAWLAWFDSSATGRFCLLTNQLQTDLPHYVIALETDALLLSANLRDFQQVPGLRVENWLQ